MRIVEPHTVGRTVGKRDRCEDQEDDSSSSKYEEPGTSNSN